LENKKETTSPKPEERSCPYLQKDITLLSVLQERKIQAGVEFAYVS